MTAKTNDVSQGKVGNIFLERAFSPSFVQSFSELSPLKSMRLDRSNSADHCTVCNYNLFLPDESKSEVLWPNSI